MFSKNIKIIFRKIKNDKTLSVLKVAGLVLAFCVTIPLVCNISYQKSFDRFHPNSDRVYNIYVDEIYRGTHDVYGECPLAVGAYIKDLFPEVEQTVRTKDNHDVSISNDQGNTFNEDVLYADPSFADVFYLKLVSGDKSTFLEQPRGVYIAESLSKKIFGGQNPLGEPLKVNNQGFTVSGVFKDYPQNSHQKFTVLLPLKSYVKPYDPYSWESYEFLTYIKFKNTIDAKTFEGKAQTLISNYLVPWLKTHYNLDYVFDDKNSIKMRLIPVTQIHLHGSSISSFEKESNVSVIYISLAIVLVLLLTAYFNLMGFAFSKVKKHQHQLNIKRFLGSSKRETISSFITENMVYTSASFLISLVVTAFVFNLHLPILSDLKNISATNYILPAVWLFLFAGAISVLCGVILGAYFNRAISKAGNIKATSYSTFWLNRAMLVAQMAASIVLIVGITVIYKQLNYISKFDLGINTKDVVIINQAYKIRDHFDAFKNELARSPLVQEVSYSNSYPFNGMTTQGYTPVNSTDQTPYPFPYFSTSIDFNDVFNFNIIEGRWFSKEMASDKNAVVINESAAKKLGFKNPVGEELYSNLSKTEKVKVIGIVSDFNFRSLHHSVEPLLIRPLEENGYWRYIEIKGKTGDRKKLVAEIGQAWAKVSGNEYLNCFFLEDRIAVAYSKEMKAKRATGLFSLIAILISCFGLLGTVLNISNEKTKEIGIRKVNGAQISEILVLLNRGFVRWVAIAYVIATPIAWYAMHRWLENFAYKTSLSWWIFALAGLLALGIALLTVSFQSWKAATRNPVESLRYE